MPNRAGKSTREMAARRRTTALWVLGAGLVIVVVIGVLLRNAAAFGLGSGTILVLLILLRVLPDLADDFDRKQYKAERRAERGAVAEECIGDLLANLGEEHLVLHDIVSPYGNIDHIVISRRAGIFLVETKAHGGRVSVSEAGILVNGHPPEKNFVAQALKNTYWLRDQVAPLVGKKPWITPVIVFTNAFVEVGRPIRGVSVINRKYLLRFIQRPTRPKAENEMLWAKRYEIDKLL